LAYKKGETIGKFVGILRTQTEYRSICENEPIRRAYSIAESENGLILDCYDQYRQGLCLLSFANCNVGAWNTVTNKKAVPNCSLVVNVEKKTFTLKCGVDKPEQFKTSKTFTITPGTELVWNYGDSFVNY
jgi:hypothetical protein